MVCIVAAFVGVCWLGYWCLFGCFDCLLIGLFALVVVLVVSLCLVIVIFCWFDC